MMCRTDEEIIKKVGYSRKPSSCQLSIKTKMEAHVSVLSPHNVSGLVIDISSSRYKH